MTSPNQLPHHQSIANNNAHPMVMFGQLDRVHDILSKLHEAYQSAAEEGGSGSGDSSRQGVGIINTASLRGRIALLDSMLMLVDVSEARVRLMTKHAHQAHMEDVNARRAHLQQQ